MICVPSGAALRVPQLQSQLSAEYPDPTFYSLLSSASHLVLILPRSRRHEAQIKMYLSFFWWGGDFLGQERGQSCWLKRGLGIVCEFQTPMFLPEAK